MISKKELEYVSFGAKRVPYPGYEYSRETLLKLRESLLKYREIYNGTEYNISFSNSEEITLEILPKNLAHMLGIQHKELMGEFKAPFRRRALGMGENEKMSSFALLNRIAECMDDVLEYEDKYGNRNLNFYKIRVKCEIFEKMANLMNFNFGCININRSVYEGVNGQALGINSQKLLFTQSNEPISPYFMIGIKPDEPMTLDAGGKNEDDEENPETLEGKYIIETLFAPFSPGILFKDQEVTIPTHILFDKNDVLTKTSATPDQKRKLISIYREIITTYNLNDRLNIYGDYMELLLQQEGFQKTIQRV